MRRTATALSELSTFSSDALNIYTFSAPFDCEFSVNPTILLPRLAPVPMIIFSAPQ